MSGGAGAPLAGMRPAKDAGAPTHGRLRTKNLTEATA